MCVCPTFLFHRDNGFRRVAMESTQSPFNYIYVFILSVGGVSAHMHAVAHVRRTRQHVRVTFSFRHVGPGGQTGLIRLDKCLYLLSYLASLLVPFSSFCEQKLQFTYSQLVALFRKLVFII